MDTGIRIRWGKIVPGREQMAADLFSEAMEYYERKRTEGAITFFEPFFLRTADFEEEQGFFLIKGEDAKVLALMEEEEFLAFVQKAMLLLEHVQVDRLWVGEEIPRQMDRFAKVRAELGV